MRPGVTMSIALILQYMAGGTRWIEARLRIRPISWIGLGLLCAALTGMGAWVFGYPFLTSHFRYLDLPGIGKVPAATALLFDLGVFAVVVGRHRAHPDRPGAPVDPPPDARARRRIPATQLTKENA